MVVSRVSTQNVHQRTIADALKVQSNLATLQGQISSGNKSTNFQGLNGKVETFVQMEAKMKKTQTFVDNNNLVISRLQTTEVALDQIIDIADAFKNLLVTRNNGAVGNSVQFKTSAEAMLKSLGGQLNTQQEGRYLFAGTKTDTPPVLENIPGTEVPGVPDDGYYKGNNESLVVRVQENYNMEYGVRANDPAFQKLVAAMNLGLTADANNSDEQLTQATEMIADALSDVIAVRARVQQNIVNINDINDRHSQLKLYWKGFTESISKTDIVAASIEVSTNQAVLQASFQAFSTISQLKLTDYIR